MSPATLLSLPREIRDQILDLCLTTALPPPCPTQEYTSQPIPSSIFITSSGRKKWQPLFNFPRHPQTNGGGLLLTSRQIGAETRDALERLHAHGKLSYVMRLRIEEEEGDATGERERYWVDWVVLPTRTWPKDSIHARDATSKGKESLQPQQDDLRQPVNLVVQVEKTMREKPTPEDENQDQQQGSLPSCSEQHQQHRCNDQEPPQHLSALFRRYHFLCRPELRPPLPPPPPVVRSLLRVAEHGVLLLHWTLGDMVAGAVTEGPCCFSKAPPMPAPPPSSPPSSSSRENHPITSSSHTAPFRPHPRPFTLTLSCSPAAPTHPAAASPLATHRTQTQPLGTPLLEFLPFHLHSAKLAHSPFRALVARGLLRRFDVTTLEPEDGPREHGGVVGADPARASAATCSRPRGQAVCPVPAPSCACANGQGQGQGQAWEKEGHLHRVCEAVRRAGEAESDRERQRREAQAARDYDDDW